MEQHGISKLDLKRRNRMQVLKTLKQNGPTSRIDIATSLHLTRAAVTIITTDMINQGIIYELGEYKHTTEKAPRGRKKILIDINYNYKFVIGVTVEDNIVSVGLSTLSGEVLDKRNMDIDRSTTQKDIYDYIEKSIREVLTNNCLDEQSVLGIGFGVYPHMYSKLNIEVKDGTPDYSKLEAYIRERTDIPLAFENSVTGMAMANIDFRKKIDPSIKNIAFIQYGNSIDFLSTYLHEPVETYHNRTDFINKMIVDPNAKDICSCGRRGCAENEITAKVIKREITNIFSKDSTPFLYNETDGNSEKINSNLILQAYKNGDKAVVQIIDRAFVLMSALINNLDFFTDPHRIVIHTLYFNATDAFEMIKSKTKKIAGDEIANKLVISNIDEKHRFLSGCAIAERELFFNKGGFDN